MPRFLLILLGLLLLSGFTFGQDCSSRNINFKSGERITYRAVYNWGFIWVNAGDVEFMVYDTIYMGKPALHFKSQGWSLKQYDWIFKVRDRFESFLDPITFKPLWFERDTYEGGFLVYNRYKFNYSDNTLEIASQTSDRPFSTDTVPLKNCTFDVLSAIYYCRTLNFDSYNKGDTIPLTMAIDNEIFDLYLRYLGREELITRDGQVYKTIRFSAMLVEGTIFKGGEDLEVWVTDDKNRVPILIEAKILVGSVKAVLTGMEGLMFPENSLIKTN
jgi:hypothetical protein